MIFAFACNYDFEYFCRRIDMDSDYIDILKRWERDIADPAIYEHLDYFFPRYQFRRVHGTSSKDHWASRYKLDLSLPKMRRAEKTVVYASDFLFREQGEWDNPVRVIDKLMQDEHLSSIYETYKFVDTRLGLGMPLPDSPKVARVIAKAGQRARILAEMMEYFSSCLATDKSAKAGRVRSYLRQERGFSLEEAGTLHLGFVPSWNQVIRHFTLDLKYSFEDVNAACPVMSEGRTSVGTIHVLAIPFLRGGKPDGFIFRRIDDSLEGPKYLVNAGLDRKSAFFNIPSAVTGDLIVVEGEMDALKATASGVPGVVAIGGSEIAGDRRRQVEDAFARGARRIILCLDLDAMRDEAAQPNFAARHEHLMKSVHTIKDVDPRFEEIYVVQFPEITDPDEYIRSRGVEAFHSLLHEAVPYWKYLYEYMLALNSRS